MGKAKEPSDPEGAAHRKRAASALNGSPDIFKFVFDHAIDGILAIDVENKKIRIANKAIGRMLGCSLEELTKLSIADIHPPENLPEIVVQFERMILKDGSVQDIPVKRKDGSVFYVDINSSKVKIDGKKHLVGIFRDSTNRKKVEEMLSKNYEQFKQIFNLSPDGMVISTVDEGRYLAINNAMQAIFGRRREEMLGRTAKELNIWGNPAERDLLVKKLIKQKVVQSSEAVLRRRSGEHFYAALSVGFVDYEGKKCLIFTVRDVDKHRKMEEMLKKAFWELKEDKKLLTKKNIAFQEVIKEIEIEKNMLKDDVIINANHIILPIVKRIRLKDASSRKYLDLLEKSLGALTSSFGRKLAVENLKLTPKEIEVCNMIKSGLTTKEMSKLLNLSSQTLDQHRKNIRKKLAISHKGTNLTTYLQNL